MMIGYLVIIMPGAQVETIMKVMMSEILGAKAHHAVTNGCQVREAVTHLHLEGAPMSQMILAMIQVIIPIKFF